MKVLALVIIVFSFYLPSRAQLDTVHPDTIKIRELKKRSLDFSETGIYDSIIACELQLQILFGKYNRWNEVVKSEIEIASSQMQKSAFDQAQLSIEKGFALIKQIRLEDPYLYGELYNLYGVLYYEQGDYEKAIGYLKKSLAHQLKLGNRANSQDLAAKFNNVGAIISRMGDYDEAIYYYKKSLNLRKRYEDPMLIGESYNNLSVSYYRKKMFHEAIAYQKKYLEILDKENTGNRINDHILCYNSLGVYYFELKDYPKALEILNKALTLNRTSEYLIEKTYHNLGYVYRMLENDKQAFYFLQLALEKNKAKYKNGHPDIGKEYRHMGIIYTRKSNPAKGLYYFQKALNHLVDNFNDSSIAINPSLINIRSRPDLLRTLRDKANALRVLSKNRQEIKLMTLSLTTFQLAMNLVEQMRDEYESEAARQFINEEALPIYSGALETINCLLDSKATTSSLELAFEIIEKSKALLLMESLQRKKSVESFGVPDSVLAKERRLRVSVAFYEKQLAESTKKNDSVQIAHASRYLQTYNEKSRQLQNEFEKNYPNYFAHHNHYSIVSLGEMKAFLKDQNTSMIEYFLDENKVWIYLITPDGVKLIEKEKPFQFDQWVALYKKCLTDYAFITDSSEQCYEQYKTSAYNLYKFLLSDVAQEIPSSYRKLLIVPHDELAYLPFESFLVNPVPGNFNGYRNLNYLIKEFEISYSYSGSLYVELHKRNNKISPNCIAFAPSFDSENLRKDKSLMSLPTTRIELESIRQIVDGDFFLGSEATKKTFKEKSGRYGIIHLATHSVMDEHNPANSRVYFAPVAGLAEEGILYAYEIANLSLRADLVVLSSCETGTGRLAKGEGILSIGRSFIYAGSRSVLMNLWRSEDKSNATIISSFYALLNKGESKINSLRQAKLKYLGEADEFQSHPAFWAGYVLVGHEGKINKKNPLLILVVLGVCGIIFFVGFMIKYSAKNK